MLIEQIDYKDNVIINLIPENEFHTVQVAGNLFCVHVRYKNLKFIGSGSQGIVCSAFDRIFKQTVAIKKIKSPFTDVEDAKRAYRELKLLKHVNYKYIIKLLDAFIISADSNQLNLSPTINQPSSTESSTNQTNQNDQIDLYLIMEYVEMNLSQIICYKFDHERLSYLIYQMFCALKYLNDSFIIHRDIKPSNIGIKKDCSIKILDFGSARTENEYMMSTYVQTRYYRSPELLLGLDCYSSIVDVWSIGCIMAEMITGRVLFCGANSIDQWEKIVDLLGTPEQSFIDKLPASISNYIKRKTANKGLSFQKIFPDSLFTPDNESKNELARDLLSKILVINPEKRITIDEALVHDYLKIWLNKEDFIHSGVKLKGFIDKEYESVEDWKKLINKELKNYPHHNFYY